MNEEQRNEIMNKWMSEWVNEHYFLNH